MNNRSQEIKTALEIATAAHYGQKRKFTGEPYITHPIAVAESVNDDPDAQIVALLHDVLEDCKGYTPERLIKMGVDQYLVGVITLLTKMQGESYMSYLGAIKTDPLAKRVKLADIRHNLLTCPPGTMKNQYHLAIYFLEN